MIYSPVQGASNTEQQGAPTSLTIFACGSSRAKSGRNCFREEPSSSMVTATLVLTVLQLVVLAALGALVFKQQRAAVVAKA